MKDPPASGDERVTRMPLSEARFIAFEYDTMVVRFSMTDGATEIRCRISTSAMDKLAGDDGVRLKADEREAQFIRLRILIEEGINRKYAAGEFEGRPAGIVLRAIDVAGRIPGYIASVPTPRHRERLSTLPSSGEQTGRDEAARQDPDVGSSPSDASDRTSDPPRHSPSQGMDTCRACGHVVTAPIRSTCSPSGEVINEWQCSACGNGWLTEAG